MANGAKSFEFGTRRASSEKIVGKFDIDGVEFEIRPLADAVPSFVIYKVTNAEGDEIVKHVLDFMEIALTKESSKKFSAMALGQDGGNGLNFKQIAEIFHHVLAVVGANPTGSSSESSPRRRKSGSASTATAPAAE